jgi:hypothetical protein
MTLAQAQVETQRTRVQEANWPGYKGSSALLVTRVAAGSAIRGGRFAALSSTRDGVCSHAVQVVMYNAIQIGSCRVVVE